MTDNLIFIQDTSETPSGLRLMVESPVMAGSTTGPVTALYMDGTAETCTDDVVQLDVVGTIAGAFDAYRVDEACFFPGGAVSSNSTNWLYPPLFYVKSISGDAPGNVTTLDMESFSLAPLKRN